VVEKLTRDERGITAPYLAAYGNHFTEVQSIIEHGAEVNAQDEDELTALDRAASEGHDTVVGVDARNDDSHSAMTAPEHHGLQETRITMESQQIKEVFKYDNLSEKDHIRVAVIDPGTPEEVLKVTLYQGPVDFCAQIPYFAISYTWEDTSIKTDIVCCEKPMKIGSNLYSALRRLQNPTQRVCIWADALCIDQESIEERTAQVALMKNIYANAKYVFVWLGDEDEDTPLAFRALLRLTALYNPATVTQSWPKEMESVLFESEMAPITETIQTFYKSGGLAAQFRPDYKKPVLSKGGAH
jgi:hypothetical protein